MRPVGSCLNQANPRTWILGIKTLTLIFHPYTLDP